MIEKAITNLCPGASFFVENDDYKTIVWYDDSYTMPSESAVNDELAKIIAEHPAKEIRAERNRLLTNTDWVVIKYKELGKAVPAVWKSYRQALRDITEQEGFPHDVTFPEEPTES